MCQISRGLSVLRYSYFSLIPLKCKDGDYGKNCQNCKKGECPLCKVWNENSPILNRRKRVKKVSKFNPKNKINDKKEKNKRIMLLTKAYSLLEKRGLSPLDLLPMKGNRVKSRDFIRQVKNVKKAS